MPVGSFTFSPPDPNLGGIASPVGVFLFDPSFGYSALPNVQCSDAQIHEGADPPAARFHYILDSSQLDSPFPNQFEQLWPLNLAATNQIGQYVVTPDSRLVVLVGMPDGSLDILFDGFARMPQVDVSGESQAVSFSAVGVEFRCWDIPIKGRVQRNGDPAGLVTKDGSKDIQTRLPTRFNPVDSLHPTGQPNCTPDTYNTGQSNPATSYPVFCDPGIDPPTTSPPGQKFPPPPTLWTLSGAVRYILSIANPTPTDGSIQFVVNPNFTDLDNVLDNRKPISNSGFFNPSNPSSYTANPIVIRDFDCTNMGWPEALERLLGYYGFGMRWVITQDFNGFPIHTFDVYRKDAANPSAPKAVFMQVEGDSLDPSASNTQTMSAAFDYHSLANEFLVETHPNRFEVSVVLAALFQPTATDSVAANRTKFDKVNLDNAADAIRMAYRWYGVDECGYGHYDFVNKVMKYTPFDFSDLFPARKGVNGGPSTPTYVVRFRPGRRDCLTDDGNGDTYKAQLALSRDYTGKVPALFDGTGTWQPITGDWSLLEDQLGIEFTADSPEKIHSGKWSDHGANMVQNSGSVLKGITSIASPGTKAQSNALFYLRLTTVIESDAGIEASARKRQASPIQNTVQRRINAVDHFRKDTIHFSSAFYPQEIAAQPNVTVDTNKNLIPRDDTSAARDHAAQLRTAHECPSIPMTIGIPGISLAYAVGDRISLVEGRDVSLQVNAGTEQQEGPAYPFVVSLSWSFTGNQQMTHLQLSDRRMDPQPLQHRRGR